MVQKETIMYAHGSAYNHGCEAIVRSTVDLLSLQKEKTSDASLISLVGNRYGKLLVIERVENNRFGPGRVTAEGGPPKCLILVKILGDEAGRTQSGPKLFLAATAQSSMSGPKGRNN